MLKNRTDEKIKIHLGCGSVYLKGYINIDGGKNVFINGMTEANKIKRDNETTIDNYYKRKFVSDKKIVQREIYADINIDFKDLPLHFNENSVDEILMVQVFEHIRKDELSEHLKIFLDVLKKGGTLIIDVPDIVRTMEKAYNSFLYEMGIEEIEYCLRLIFGSGKNTHYVHYDGYYYEKLDKILKNAGFKSCRHWDNIFHNYPTFGIIATK